MQINVAIQLLPFGNDIEKYAIIDDAIAIIQQSGMKYVVCPFETVVEGEYEQVFKLVEEIKTQSLKRCEDVVINIKIHAANRELKIADKLEKY
ncbi:MAG: hypothetical protein K0R65_2388 [Crocinitomicaceae bacterium]|jgi:uncharacterized protein YqgV (UPF0045/DUF77 family)|nr:hypothetical protein [Crocinitomicaceae bacterium]